MPHDAHPMGVLVSAMSALSVFHPDANPALRVRYLSLETHLQFCIKPKSRYRGHACENPLNLYFVDIGSRSIQIEACARQANCAHT